MNIIKVAIKKTCPFCIRKCSTIGPRLSAGKNVSAPTITITPTSSVVNSGVVTGNVPSDSGIRFLRLRLPAIASGGMIMKKRPKSIVRPSVVLYAEGIDADAAERGAVVGGGGRMSAEGLRTPVRTRVEDARRAETWRHRSRCPVKVRINSEKIRTVSIAICTSKA